ncbi:MAG: peptidoglycan-binding protein LysM [Saprospiraceae bacterium]|nr:peptidoglycan-binding protein LysM [Saprospiraceae bacterium]
MGLFSFLKDVGEQIFEQMDQQPKKNPTTKKDLPKPEVSAEEQYRQKIQLLTKVIKKLGIQIKDLDLSMQGTTVVVSGEVQEQEEREKIILALGNVAGVSAVDDRIMVNTPQPKPEATFYEVKKGDSLSKIAKAQYGDPMKYKIIFEANQPMLSNPDLIYPGQILRIPPEK